jgi:hypothetical protein
VSCTPNPFPFSVCSAKRWKFSYNLIMLLECNLM